MTDVKYALEAAALRPEHELDVGALHQRAAQRRRARRRVLALGGGLGALALVGVLTVAITRDGDSGGGSVVAGGGSTSQPAVTSSSEPPTSSAPPASSAPAQSRLEFADSLPEGWQRVAGPLYNDISLDRSGRPQDTVATFDIPAEIHFRCDFPIAAMERLGPTDAFVSVVTSGGPMDLGPRPDETAFLPPLESLTEQDIAGTADITPSLCLARGGDFRFNVTLFTENGLTVRVFVGIGLEADSAREQEVLALTRSLRVGTT